MKKQKDQAKENLSDAGEERMKKAVGAADDETVTLSLCLGLLKQLPIVTRARVVGFLYAKCAGEAMEEVRKLGIPKAPAAPVVESNGADA